MMVTGAQVVDWAKSKVGQHEDPMGSNSGAFVISCQQATFLGGTHWPWCAAFVCKDAKSVGVPLAYNGAGAHDIADHHKPWVAQAGWEPGMVVDLNIGSGHTAIIASVDHAHGILHCIDGNWGDRVATTEHAFSLVRAVWKIPGVRYQSGTATHPAAAKPPKWVVTTSATGHKKVFRRKRGLIRFLQRHVFPKGITIKRGRAA